MAIPQIPDFERFLSSISTDAHAAKDGRQFFDVIGAKNHFDGKAYSHTPAMSVSYLPGEITFGAALTRLGKEVRKSDHLANDSMLRLLFGMSAASRVSFEELTRKKLLFSPIERVKLDSRSQTAFALLRLEDV